MWDGPKDLAHMRQVQRFTFWYGWIWGAACTSGFLLVVRLIWITG